jgi:hypothetical protein
VAARSRWASLARPLVCRRTGLVVPKIPRGPAAYGRSARDGPSAPGERKTKRARLSRLLHQGPVPSVRRARLPNRGVRERPDAVAGCHAAPQSRIRSAANTERKLMPEKTGIALNACADSEVALGESRLQGSQASLNSNCQKTGESNFFHLRQRGTLHATSSSTLSNSTNGWLGWQRRS